MERSSFVSEIPIYEIPGGIHPEEHKTRSNQADIRRLSLAEELVINLKGQAGNRSLPIVQVGDKVLKGQVIAECDGIFSAYQHAPTSGEVIAIENRTIAHPSGLDDLCIVLKADGKDEWCELSPVTNIEDMDREAVLTQIFEKGVVGLGGASFPSHIKLKQHEGIHTLIINAAECEPYITCDDKLLQEHAKDVLLGAEIISKLYHNIDIIIGIEDNKPQAIDAIQQAREELELNNIKLGVVPTKYPSGGEKQLIQLLTGKEVPHGKLPADLGLVMHNVGTCYAIQQALTKGKPLVERLVTLTGDNCKKPGNYWVPFGTPVKHLVQATDSETPKRLIMGGPMMGYQLPSADVGIVKATNCIIMSADGELGMDQTALPCIRCGACMDACPASLLPQQLFWHAQADEFDKATSLWYNTIVMQSRLSAIIAWKKSKPKKLANALRRDRSDLNASSGKKQNAIAKQLKLVKKPRKKREKKMLKKQQYKRHLRALKQRKKRSSLTRASLKRVNLTRAKLTTITQKEITNGSTVIAVC